MFSSLIVIVAVGVIIYGVKRWQSLPESERASFAKKAVIYAAAAVVLGLVASGRAHWLMGVLAGLLALAGRLAQFSQYMPMFKKMMGDEPEPSQAGSLASSKQGMTKQAAADILGIDVLAQPDDVRMAHKRLIQKMHPDRGGSDALAKQINLAKDVLLG
ncbi:MAG: flagellar biosynthesis component FlhA [Arenicella sp.]